MKSILTILLFAFACQGIHGQGNQRDFDLVEGTEEVKLGKINGIVQDTAGYIWFCDQGTASLVRYDGHRMIVFKHDDNDSNSLGPGSLESIATDSKGQIWIGFGGPGMDCYNPKTRRFTHFHHNEKDPSSLTSGAVFAMREDHVGNIWVGTDNGLDVLDAKTGRFKHFKHDSANARSLSDNVVRTIYEDKSGVMWIGTGFPWAPNDNGGLNRFNRESQDFDVFRHNPKDPASIASNKVQGILEDSHGNFWIGSGGIGGIQLMDRKTGKFRQFVLDSLHHEYLNLMPIRKNKFDNNISFILEDSTHKLWFGTLERGLIRYDPIHNKVTRFENSNGFPDYSTYQACISRDGVIWIATEDTHILFKTDGAQTKFAYTKLPQPPISFLEDGSGGFYFGTELAGLIHFHNNDSIEQLEIPNFHSGGYGESILSMKDDHADSIWAATTNGIYIFRKSTKTFQRFNQESNEANAFESNIGYLFKSSRNELWIGTRAGVTRVELATGKITHFNHNERDSTSMPAGFVTNIIEDKAGAIWMGFPVRVDSKGIVIRYDSSSGRFKTYKLDGDHSKLYSDPNGRLWAWSENGLYQYDFNEDAFRLIKAFKSPDFVDPIFSMIADHQRRLWISSRSAIYLFKPASNEWILFGRKYGVKAHDIHLWDFFVTQNGKVLVSAGEGFVTIDPDELDVNVSKPALRITDLILDNEVVNPGMNDYLHLPVEQIDRLDLPYNKNTFGFNFALLDFSDLDRNKFYTRLLNYDSAWRNGGSERAASYSNIPPGDYIFEIKAANSNGIPSYRSLNIRIHPPWWRTWWAYALYTLLTIAIAFLIYQGQKRRIIKAEREKTKDKELAQAKEIEKAYTTLKETQAQLVQSEKMASLGELTAGIAHEIQNPLNFVNNFSDVNTELLAELREAIKTGKSDEAVLLTDNLAQNMDKINAHGKRADAIVKSMMEHSRSGSGQKQPVDLNALCDEYLRLSYHGLRAKEKDFNAQLETDFDPNLTKVNVIPQDFGRVILNILNNAFYSVHEKARLQGNIFHPKVKIATKGLKGAVEIKISDNGLGVDEKIKEKIFQPFFTTKPTGKGTGLGLSLSYDIITKAHSGKLQFESTQGTGAEFTIVLPSA